MLQRISGAVRRNMNRLANADRSCELIFAYDCNLNWSKVLYIDGPGNALEIGLWRHPWQEKCRWPVNDLQQLSTKLSFDNIAIRQQMNDRLLIERIHLAKSDAEIEEKRRHEKSSEGYCTKHRA